MTLRTLFATVAAAFVTLGAAAAHAEIKTQEIEYKQGETTLMGFVAYDDAKADKRPGVLVIHEWWGHNEHARNQAKRLAEAGYVGFALDMYGKGKVATHPKDAMAFMEEATKDFAVAKARFDAGLAELKKQPQVDPEKIAIVGYCFGGGVALHMARGGVDVDAISTFHASLANMGPPAEKGAIKPKIQVHTGADDPMVNKAQVDAFKKEMKAAGGKVDVISYKGAKHSFTNPDADKVGMPALAYDAAADKKSWDATMKFFKKIWKS